MKHSIEKWQLNHDYVSDHSFGEKRSKIVLALTAITMVVEIVAGTLFGSMALLADGWHMMTHVAAFGITLFSYSYARKHKHDPDFSFSTGKVSVLGGFASAVALAVVALMMAMESLERLFSPQDIRFTEALYVAVIGLIVNLVSVFLLHEQHDHGVADHDHDHAHHHTDHNLMAAYFHVLADALTSVLAIVALLLGKRLGWKWPDPVMGVIGALVIAKWALGLMRQSSRILLDRSAGVALRDAVKSTVEADRDNQVADLHIWHVSPDHEAVVLSVVTHEPQPPAYYKKLIQGVGTFAHVSVEVNGCDCEKTE
jgi:cation diffusion facilitator family transporter